MSNEPKCKKESKLIKHGVFRQRDSIPAPIRKEAVIFRDRMIQDIAGTEDDLSGAQLILLDRALNLFAVTRQIELYAARKGAIDLETGELQPILANNYLAFSNSLRLTLGALGVKKTPKDYLGPADWEIEPQGKGEKQ